MWEEANTGAYGSGFFEGILRLCWALLSEAIITRKGEGWKESARHGWRAGISRDQILHPAHISSPFLPVLSALTHPPSAPWASRRSTWPPQTNQWSRKPCSCSNNLGPGKQALPPSWGKLQRPASSGQLSRLQTHDRASQP